MLLIQVDKVIPEHRASVIKCPVPPVFIAAIVAVSALIVIGAFPYGAFVVSCGYNRSTDI